MRKYVITLTTALLCGIMGSALFVSCQKNDTEGNEDYQRGLYSDVVPDVVSSGSIYGTTDEELVARAKDLDIEVAVLKAVVKVETGGHGGFLPDERPVILFEGHIFWQQLRTRGLNPEAFAKGNEDILYPKFDKTKYVGGVGEYERLNRARIINEDAALASASWGMFQTMGYRYRECGGQSVQEFVAKMEESELSQLDLFIALLKSNPKMVKALHDKDWRTFAMLYNGPAYAQNRYDEKLSKAYASFK